VFTAENGLEALNEVKSRPINFFDAIILDVNMPIMDGLEASNLIYNHLNNQDTVLVIQQTATYCHWKLRESKTLIFSLSSDNSPAAIASIKAHPFDYKLDSMRPEQILKKVKLVKTYVM